MNPVADIAVATAAADPVVERAERQLGLVARLVEIGMELAEALRRQVCDDGPVTVRGNPWIAFEKIARAVRQSIMLEMKIDEALRDWRGLSEAERAQRRAAAATSAPIAATEETHAEDLEDKPDADEFGRPEIERGERAERQERFWADRYVIEDEHAFREIVGRVCRDLGVTPDWSGWDDHEPGDLVVTPVVGRRPAGRWEGGPGSPIRSPLEGRRPRLRGPPG